jgi:transcriptional regulator with XRE-family HTH domain
LGITFQQVQKYERGQNRMSASMLVKIAARLETTVAALVGEGAARTEPRLHAQMATPGARQLLAAYAAISDRGQRRAVIAVARCLAPVATRRRKSG